MKKVLVITYYWPPAGGPGVQRWLKFVKYLRDFDIEPIVYIPKNPDYPLLDTTFFNEVPKDLMVYEHPIFEPYKLASIFSRKKTKRISSGVIQSKNQSFLEKVMLWVRGNLFIPDARKFWIAPSVKFLEGILDKEDIKTIITTGPPHSVHLIGQRLRNKKNLQWIADFRDPWTTIGYHKKLKLSKYAAQKHKRLESSILSSADKIIVTSSTTKKEFQNITDKPIRIITNGFDCPLDTSEELNEKFTLSHIGSMLTGRNPLNLWKVLAELVSEYDDFKDVLELQFVGVVSDDILKSIKELGLHSFVNFIGYVSHDKALQYQRKSQVLLLFEINSIDTIGIIPGKLFEYMAAQRPILGIGPAGWDVEAIVQETRTGIVFDYQSTDKLKDLILQWFNLYKNKGLYLQSKNIGSYSRKELTRNLAAFI